MLPPLSCRGAGTSRGGPLAQVVLALADGAWREISEEVGLSPSDLRLVAEHDRWTTYELPVETCTVRTGWGRTQRWHLFQMLVEPESAVARAGVATSEFRAWRWTTPRTAAAGAVAFRQPM